MTERAMIARERMTVGNASRLQELAASGREEFSACSPSSLSTSKRDDEIASGLPENLDALPRLDGFRLRGLEMTRLETFIDAAFAFAVTMMVIAAERVPDDINALLAAFRHVPAFVASVAVLGIFWRGHWKWSRRYGLEDGASILISWALLATILIYIYPLKAIFGSMFNLLSSGKVGQPLGLRTLEQARWIFAIYAIGFTALTAEILLLHLRAWHLRDALKLNGRERLLTRRELMGWSVPLSVGIVAFVLALTLPEKQVAWSGWIYFSMVILVPLQKRLSRLRE
jgi:transmembrane protein TMEM174 (potassium channel)